MSSAVAPYPLAPTVFLPCLHAWTFACVLVLCMTTGSAMARLLFYFCTTATITVKAMLATTVNTAVKTNSNHSSRQTSHHPTVQNKGLIMCLIEPWLGRWHYHSLALRCRRNHWANHQLSDLLSTENEAWLVSAVIETYVWRHFCEHQGGCSRGWPGCQGMGSGAHPMQVPNPMQAVIAILCACLVSRMQAPRMHLCGLVPHTWHLNTTCSGYKLWAMFTVQIEHHHMLESSAHSAAHLQAFLYLTANDLMVHDWLLAL